MRGRTPKPTRLKILDGQTRPASSADEPQPDNALPERPAILTGEARKEWDRITVLLLELKMLAQVDRAALAAYCQCWARWVSAEKKLKHKGAVIKSPNGCPIQNPYLGIANTALKQLKTFLTEFGLTPASRTRIRVPESEESDDLGDFLKGSA
jgi:P27 family predicted phage terminase small subunit